jgi:hypothetical protein
VSRAPCITTFGSPPDAVLPQSRRVSPGAVPPPGASLVRRSPSEWVTCCVGRAMCYVTPGARSGKVGTFGPGTCFSIRFRSGFVPPGL